ncbi:MAG: CotH protein [Bacteroidetes bacterium ADurb.Bin090]|nr:MAG: CotH protein [Bacteroidetes bacterium ADurb.Bin090]
MIKKKNPIPTLMVLAFILSAVFPAFSQKRLAIYRDGQIREQHLLSKIDSIRFVNEDQEGFWIHKTDSLLFYSDRQADSLVFFEWSASECLRRFEVPAINIQVQDNAPVLSKDKEDYLPCVVEIDGKEMYADYIGTARIRGRGNSTWLWYDKKPYRIKLDEKAKILGLGSNKDWVLLANYRDPTNLMNAFGFEMASWLGLPFTNHTRFVEVTLNGDYIGLYQLTEQVEQAGDRVDIDVNEGVLLSLDKDDGPELAPGAEDNFWSAYYHLPICVKHPEDPTEETIKMLNRWTNEDQKTTIPRISYLDEMGNSRFSDRWIEDASYLRLKTVRLSYNLPLSTTFLNGLTLWASGNNLLTLTRYLGSDPEFSSGNEVLCQGIDRGMLALGPSVVLGIKFNL